MSAWLRLQARYARAPTRPQRRRRVAAWARAVRADVLLPPSCLHPVRSVCFSAVLLPLGLGSFCCCSANAPGLSIYLHRTLTCDQFVGTANLGGEANDYHILSMCPGQGRLAVPLLGPFNIEPSAGQCGLHANTAEIPHKALGLPRESLFDKAAPWRAARPRGAGASWRKLCACSGAAARAPRRRPGSPRCRRPARRSCRAQALPRPQRRAAPPSFGCFSAVCHSRKVPARAIGYRWAPAQYHEAAVNTFG